MPPSSPKRRLFRLSLKTTLVFVTVLGILMAIGARIRHRTAVRDRLIKLIQSQGGDVSFEDFYRIGGRRSPPGPVILRRLFGENAFAKVIRLDLKTGLTHDMCDAFPDLTTLVIRDAKIGEEAFQPILHFRKLEEMGLSNCDIAPDAVKLLSQMSNLKQVSLDRFSARDAIIEALSEATQIESLTIENTMWINSSLGFLAKLKNLTGLRLTSLTSPTVASLDFLGGLEHLEGLQIADVDQIDIEQLGDVKAAKKLRWIVIEGAAISTAAMAYMSSSPLLDQLTLTDVELSSEAISQLARCKSLLELELNGMWLDDSAAAELGRLTSLQEILLHDTSLSPESLRHLSGCTSLRELDLIQDTIDDLATVYLSELRQLRSLNIVGTRITDEGLNNLCELKNLSQLHVAIGDGITNEGVTQLKQCLPQCEVTAAPQGYWP